MPRARLRMTVCIKKRSASLGTGNKIEDFGVGFSLNTVTVG